MVSIDEAEEMLNDIMDEIPEIFTKDLNGGVLLLPEAKLHPERRADDLYIMGEYHRNISMGRYIVIYYGSFERLYSHLSADQMRERLKKTLLHEFTHHIESLAGERGLEKKDEQTMANYYKRFSFKRKKEE